MEEKLKNQGKIYEISKIDGRQLVKRSTLFTMHQWFNFAYINRRLGSFLGENQQLNFAILMNLNKIWQDKDKSHCG